MTRFALLNMFFLGVLQLFERNPGERLGMPGCQNGPIRSQPFFRNIDWDKLEGRQVAPPFRPKIVSWFSKIAIL